MKPTRLVVIVAMLIGAVAPCAFAQAHAKDVRGRDHPLFTRMQGFFRAYCDEKRFDRYEFPIDATKKQAVEGLTLRVYYLYEGGSGPVPSALEIVRNHQNAIKKVGGAVVFEDTRTVHPRTVMRVIREGKTVWAELVATDSGVRYDMVIVEEEAMLQEVVANAETWRKDLGREGHVAVYGIYFDTDQAVIKPESEPALNEMAKLLAGDPRLSVFIVGHTDSTGTLEHNLRLSDARASAVVTALTTKHKIEATRLRASGVGPLAPVASNDTEEGRAKNRRVELVKR